MDNFLMELMPWLGLFCAFGVGFGVPAVILRWLEIRKERRERAEMLSWSPKVIPLHQRVDREFLESRPHWQHMNRPAERIRQKARH